jgi:hypothetical protein
MTTVSVCKRAGFTPFFQRSFDDVSEAARFVESWLPMHVAIFDESGQAIDPYTFIRGNKSNESALRPSRTPTVRSSLSRLRALEASFSATMNCCTPAIHATGLGTSSPTKTSYPPIGVRLVSPSPLPSLKMDADCAANADTPFSSMD